MEFWKRCSCLLFRNLSMSITLIKQHCVSVLYKYNFVYSGHSKMFCLLQPIVFTGYGHGEAGTLWNCPLINLSSGSNSGPLDLCWHVSTNYACASLSHMDLQARLDQFWRQCILNKHVYELINNPITNPWTLLQHDNLVTELRLDETSWLALNLSGVS